MLELHPKNISVVSNQSFATCTMFSIEWNIWTSLEHWTGNDVIKNQSEYSRRGKLTNRNRVFDVRRDMCVHSGVMRSSTAWWQFVTITWAWQCPNTHNVNPSFLFLLIIVTWHPGCSVVFEQRSMLPNSPSYTTGNLTPLLVTLLPSW